MKYLLLFCLNLFGIILLAKPIWADSATETDRQISLLQLGQKEILQHNLTAAAKTLEQYCDNYPNDPSGFYLLGKCADELGNYALASRYYAKCLMLAKQAGLDSSQLRVNLGNTLLKLHFFEPAIFDFKRALDIDEKDIIARLNLSKALILNGQHKEALIELSKLQEMGIMPIQRELILLQAIAFEGNNEHVEAKERALRYLSQNKDLAQDKLKQLAEQLSY